MPIYEFECNECTFSVEEIQAIGTETPTCEKCGGTMRYKFSPIARPILKNDGGYIIRSKGYKEGYKKEYLKSTGREAWRDKIIDAESQA